MRFNFVLKIMTVILFAMPTSSPIFAVEPMQVLTSPAALGASKPVVVDGKSLWLDNSQCYMRNEKNLPFLCFPSSIKMHENSIHDLTQFVANADERLKNWLGISERDFQIYFGAVIFTDDVKEPEIIVGKKYDDESKLNDRAIFLRLPLSKFSLTKTKSQLQSKYQDLLAKLLTPSLTVLSKLQMMTDAADGCQTEHQSTHQPIIRKYRDDQCKGYTESIRLIDIDIDNLQGEFDRLLDRENFYTRLVLNENEAFNKAQASYSEAQWNQMTEVYRIESDQNDAAIQKDPYVEKLNYDSHNASTPCYEIAARDPEYIELSKKISSAYQECWNIPEIDDKARGECFERPNPLRKDYERVRRKYFEVCDDVSYKIYLQLTDYIRAKILSRKTFEGLNRQMSDAAVAIETTKQRQAYFENLQDTIRKQRDVASKRLKEFSEKRTLFKTFEAACIAERTELEAGVPISIAKYPGKASSAASYTIDDVPELSLRLRDGQ